EASHHRSSAGHGPVHPVTVRTLPSTASSTGGADTSQRPLTVTGRPESSVTETVDGSGRTTAGAGSGTRPGQGRPARAPRPERPVGTSRRSPHGTLITRSPGPRPPARTGRVTP